MPRSHTQYSIYLSVLFMFFFGYAVQAQSNTSSLDPNKRISQYILRVWTSSEGLPAMGITDIYQSPDHYMWLGTYKGLARFDGVNFTNYSIENIPELTSNSVRVFCSVENDLWIGTQKGLLKYRQNSFTRSPEFKQLDSYSIEALYYDSKGCFWIGTTSHGLFCYENGQLMEVGKSTITRSPITSISEDNQGNIWIGTDKGGLFKYQNEHIIKQLSSEQTLGVNFMYKDPQNTLWITTGKGVFTIEDGKPKPFSIGIPSIEGVTKDSYGHLWFSNNQGLYRYRPEDESLEHFSEKDGLPNNVIRKMVFDHQGNLWIASYRSGIYQLADGVFDCFTPTEGLPNAVATHILPYNDDTFWIATEGGKIGILNQQEIIELQTSKPITSPRIKHLMKDSKGYIWISTYGGLMKSDKNGRIVRVFNEEVDNYARMTLEDSLGNIWLGTRRKGLFKLVNDQPVLHLNSDNGLSSNFIMSIILTQNGELWVGTKNGINIIKGGQVLRQIQLEDGLPSNMIFNIYEDAEKTKWVATDLGLVRVKGEEIDVIDTKSGLDENVVFDVVEDHFQHLWLSSNSGVSKISKEQINQYLRGEISKLSIYKYDKSDGMKSEECLGAAKMTVDKEGRIWIPTVQGVARINPMDKLKHEETQFPIIIEQIADERNIYHQGEDIVIPPGSKRLTFAFTAFNYTAPSRLKFRCKLVPFDNDWIDVNNKERKVVYTNLPPGKYTLQIQVKDKHKEYDDTGLRGMDFSLQAYFYQTKLFYLMAIAGVIAIIYLLYSARVRQIRENELLLQLRVQERTEEISQQKERIEAQHLALEKALEELREAQSRAVQSEKMASIGQLTAGIAHEINNPINFVYAGTNSLNLLMGELMQILEQYEILEATEDRTNQQTVIKHLAELKKTLDYQELKVDIPALLRDISHGAERTTEIVNSLRTFSRDDSDLATKAAISEIMDATLVVLRNSYKGKVEIQKLYQDIPQIQCHAGKLGQVFSNIITNAVQAIEGKGEISISIYPINRQHPKWPTELLAEQDYIQICIADNGPGIPEEIQKKIFDPFFTTKDVGKGTGLGLSITYGIIEKHHGNIELDSKEGKGTAFYITLPVKQ